MSEPICAVCGKLRVLDTEPPMPICDCDDGPRRHDILDLAGGGYISINRPKDAPPLTHDEQEAFRTLAAAGLEHVQREDSQR